MATGLEKIKSKIQEQSKKNCDEMFQQTDLEIKKILTEARNTANEKADEIISKAKKEAEIKINTAKSVAESITRNRYLEIRNAILNDVISAAYEKIEHFTDEEYFDMIFRLFVKNVQPGECTMYFSGYDIVRLPEDFQQRIDEHVQDTAVVHISSESRRIDNGFILDYGEIQINCTLKAVFDEYMDRLKDVLSKELFN